MVVAGRWEAPRRPRERDLEREEPLERPPPPNVGAVMEDATDSTPSAAEFSHVVRLPLVVAARRRVAVVAVRGPVSIEEIWWAGWGSGALGSGEEGGLDVVQNPNVVTW